MASNTLNINLYKKDMATDGNDTFNITTMLNDNWDKIDTKFGQQDKDFIRQPAFLSATSTNNVYTATSTPEPTAYIDGMGIVLKADKDSTGAITLNWNGLGTKALKDAQGNNISLKANGIYTFKYNSDIGYFILQGSNIYANGVMQTNLNADMVDGKNASDFATSTQGTKADNALPASTYTANDILTKLKTIDGSGSGLDADLLDGKNSSDFASSTQGAKADNALPATSYTASDVLSKIKSVDGSGSGLDADLIDGHDSSYFAKTTDIPSSLPASGGNSNTVNGFSASGTPNTTEKTNLIGMVNEVFTSANNSLTQVNSGKTNIYNAIVGKSVTPTSNSFADLVTAIGNISTGKRFATGTHPYTGGTPSVVYNEATGQANVIYYTISTTFTPSIVIACNNVDRGISILIPLNDGYQNKSWKTFQYNNSSFGTSVYNIMVSSPITANTIPFMEATQGTIEWIAIE